MRIVAGILEGMNSAKARIYFLLVLLFGSATVAFLVLKPFLTTIALAAVFAVILYPLYKALVHRVSSHSIAALITVLLGCLFVVMPLTLVGSLVLNQSRSAYNSLVSGSGVESVRQATTNAAVSLEPYIPGAAGYANSISLEIDTYLQQLLQWLISRVGVAFTSILGLVLRFFIFFMALYYFLKEGVALEKFLIKKSPLSDEDSLIISKQLSHTITSVVKGSFAIACVQGLLASIGYLLFGVPNAALWGVSTAVSALIPGIGTSLVMVPAVIYLFATGNIGGGIALALWGTFLVGLIDNFLAPRLMGKGAQLHPLIILLSILGGVIFYGPSGIFLGPLTISFLFAVYTVYTSQASAT